MMLRIQAQRVERWQMSEEKEHGLSQTQVPLTFKRAADFRLHFSNNIQIAAGQHNEIQIFFGQIILPPLGPTPELIEVEQQFGIVVTFSLARRLFQLLEEHLPKIEKAF